MRRSWFPLLGAIIVVGGLVPARAEAAPTVSATLIRTVRLSNLSPPIPDSAGITYLPLRKRLLVSDSEVDEMSIFQGVNLFTLTRRGRALRTGTTAPTSNEPTGVSYSAIDGHLYVSDDNKKVIFEMGPGRDGSFGTKDDSFTRFSTVAFGDTDPEDLAIDPTTGALFVLSGLQQEVYRLDPGPDGVLDGVAPAGDDIVTHFDVGGFGAGDPEGMGFDAGTGAVLLVDRVSKTVYGCSPTGALLFKIDITAANSRRPAGVTVAPSTANPNVNSLYIVDRGVDNNANPNENDGKLYEMSYGSAVGRSGLAIPVSKGSDDAVQSSGGGVDLRGHHVRIGSRRGNQVVGIRFGHVEVPRGARVSSAFVQFRSGDTQRVHTSLSIAAEAAGDAAKFRARPKDITSRKTTRSRVRWRPARWTKGEAGRRERTPNLARPLRRVIGSPHWRSGNAVAFIISGTGIRTADSFDGNRPPVLHLRFRSR